jgi:hypothetical protein
LIDHRDIRKTGFSIAKEKVEEDFRMLQNRYPKHPLVSTHSTHRSQTTDLLPIAMTISDPKETRKKEKKKKRLDSRIRTGDKLASLEYSTLMSLPESSYDYNQNYFQILKTKQKKLGSGGNDK